jgi:L-threonylcarbamoyladenylate synthase
MKWFEPHVGTVHRALWSGEVIAYPTEGVYGLGCDPTLQAAVDRILQVKQRSHAKGFIVVASHWYQCQPWVNVTLAVSEVQHMWATPITWLLPASQKCPPWLIGKYNTLAVRISHHPVICQLCASLNRPLLSTSANVSGHAPARCVTDVIGYFNKEVKVGCLGNCGPLQAPTPIKDYQTGVFLRKIL